MTDVASEASALYDELGQPEDATVEQIETKLKELTDRQVQMDLAKASVRRQFGGSNGNGGSPDGDQLVTVDEINSDDQWADMKVNVTSTWESDSDAVKQKGKLADETGSIDFIEFSNDGDFPTLEEGESYYLKNLVSMEDDPEYGGGFTMKINKTTEVVEDFDEDVSATKGISAPVVDTQKGTGLIKRCPECNSPLNDGRCYNHGDVADHTKDLRIKAVLDDGVEETKVVFLDAEQTEELVGIDLDEATEMAMDAMDTSVVAEEINEKIVGKYFNAEISHYRENWWFGEEFARDNEGVSEEQAVDVLAEVLEVEQ